MSIIGHENTKRQLVVAMAAARRRNMALPHMLFSGAPGCGKTSLARYIAQVAGTPFLSVVPNNLNDYKSVLKVLEQLDHTNYDELGNRTGPIRPTVLFLDEVHNLPLKGQELLGLVMEKFRIEANKPNMYHWVPFFTLIGATTIAGKLSKPFRDRFKLNFAFKPYSLEEMTDIISYHSEILRTPLSLPARLEIAKRSRGTPRVAVGFVERIRDKMLSENIPVASEQMAVKTFEEMGIDGEGFNDLEIRLLKTLSDADRPVSLDNLSVIIQEDPKSIRDFAEPYLIRRGMLLVSGKGRIITTKGKEYLNSSGQTDKLIKKEINFDYERS